MSSRTRGAGCRRSGSTSLWPQLDVGVVLALQVRAGGFHRGLVGLGDADLLDHRRAGRRRQAARLALRAEEPDLALELVEPRVRVDASRRRPGARRAGPRGRSWRRSRSAAGARAQRQRARPRARSPSPAAVTRSPASSRRTTSSLASNRSRAAPADAEGGVLDGAVAEADAEDEAPAADRVAASPRSRRPRPG